MRGPKLAFAFLSAGALFACDTEHVGPGTSEYKAGSLGYGGFAYDCDESVECGLENSAKQFPTDIAVGSQFSVRYVEADPSQNHGVATIKSIGEGVLVVSPRGGFEAKAPGWTTLVAYDGQGRIVEYAPIAVAQPAALAIIDGAATGSASQSPLIFDPPNADHLAPGEKKVLNAAARGQTGRPLAGALPCTWTSSDESVATVGYDLEQRVNVVAKAKGTADITATCGVLEASMPITVD